MAGSALEEPEGPGRCMTGDRAATRIYAVAVRSCGRSSFSKLQWTRGRTRRRSHRLGHARVSRTPRFAISSSKCCREIPSSSFFAIRPSSPKVHRMAHKHKIPHRLFGQGVGIPDRGQHWHGCPYERRGREFALSRRRDFFAPRCTRSNSSPYRSLATAPRFANCPCA